MVVGGGFNTATTRVHAWAFKFFPYDLERALTQPMDHQRHAGINFKADAFLLSKWRNLYLNNRRMGDENRYIFERQNLQEKPIGLILDKPTVLLKRNYIRDTTFQEEQLNVGSTYDKV